MPVEPTGGWEEPEYGDYGYDMDWSRLAEERDRMDSAGTSRRLESGEIVDLWFGALVADETNLSDIVPAVNRGMHVQYQAGWVSQ